MTPALESWADFNTCNPRPVLPQNIHVASRSGNRDDGVGAFNPQSACALTVISPENHGTAHVGAKQRNLAVLDFFKSQVWAPILVPNNLIVSILNVACNSS